MKIDQGLAEEWECGLRDAIELNSEIEADEGESILFSDVDKVETFKGNGVTVKLNDGSIVDITIQAYRKEKEQMSGMEYHVLRDGVVNAIANLQTDFLQKSGIEDITQINTELNKEFDEAIDKIANCIWKQMKLERNPICVHYCEKDDMTFIMQDCYNDYGNLYRQHCIGWYYGEPNAELTKKYAGNLVAEYTSADHRLRGADR